MDIVGIVPAAGRATRLGRLPFSKELYPIGRPGGAGSGRGAPPTACEYLLATFRTARIEKAWIIVRGDKWDIPQYLLDGEMHGIRLAYVVVGSTNSAAETLDRAYPWIEGQTVMLGFPDIIVRPVDLFARLVERHRRAPADVTLGLIPAARPDKFDMISIDPDGNVRDVVIKPTVTDLRLTWVGAVLKPAFTGFMHEELAGAGGRPGSEGHAELHVGDIIRRAVRAGLSVRGVPFAAGECVDIGTSEDLDLALRRFTGVEDVE